MPALVHQRCFNHAEREAVARCPQCLRFFCRECVTDHEGKVLCAACLKAAAARNSPGWERKAWLLAGLQCVGSVVLAWFFFYLVAEWLLAIPDDFHKGQLWKVGPLDPE